jgi:hypothetical protein
MAVLQSDGVNHTSDLILRRNGTEGLRLTSSTVQVSSINDGPLAGFRNAIINGNFDIWQRGTSFTDPTSASTSYTADRWSCYRGGFASGLTITRITGIGFAGNNRTAIRIQRTSGNTSTASISISQSLESINSNFLAGQPITLSFRVRRGANYSGSGNNLSCTIVSSTGTDQHIRDGVTGSVDVAADSKTLSTTYQVFTITGTAPSNSNQIHVRFNYTPSGTAGADDWLELLDVQLEPGPVATPFERRPIGTELALCQRYFEKSAGASGFGTMAGSTSAFRQLTYYFKVEKRATPSVTTTFSSGTTGVQNITTTSAEVLSNVGNATADALCTSVVADAEL